MFNPVRFWPTGARGVRWNGAVLKGQDRASDAAAGTVETTSVYTGPLGKRDDFCVGDLHLPNFHCIYP